MSKRNDKYERIIDCNYAVFFKQYLAVGSFICVIIMKKPNLYPKESCASHTRGAKRNRLFVEVLAFFIDE